MSLAGNLRTMSLPDILQWIAVGRKTGTLHLERRAVRKQLMFKDGAIFSSWSNDPRESLGQFLVSERFITEEQLFRALLAQEKEGRLVGSILVDSGTLGEDDLRRALRAKAEESIYDLFHWDEGAFEFKEDELPGQIHVHLDLAVQGVVLEGIRRVDEWARIRKVFPSMRTRFAVKGDGGADVDDLDRRALALAAAGKSMAEIALEMHRTDFDTAAHFFDLRARDLIAIADVPVSVVLDDPLAAIAGLLAAAEARLAEKRLDEALKAYESVLALDRLNQQAKKGLLAVSEARSRERALKRVALDKVPALKKSLQALTQENFDPQEGFILSRVNGQWDVKSILKLIPIPEDDAILIFSRLIERGVIALYDAEK
ncbi:MAG TPA: DUF4388 domain-containing protein [Vicinamibacteria bacterium]|nr:DUF4388 domain-containing protein [Vicinamibacteria bacterium]